MFWRLSNRDNRNQFLVGVFASLGSALYGYDLGVIAEVVGCNDYQTRFTPTSDET